MGVGIQRKIDNSYIHGIAHTAVYNVKCNIYNMYIDKYTAAIWI